jgi:hypothetical protein
MTEPNPNTTRIVAAILDTQQLTLYLPDASTIVISQGDPRVQRIVDEATVPLSQQGFADVYVGHQIIPQEDNRRSYTDFEEQTSGVVKFFRVAKSWLKGVFYGDEVEGNRGSNGTLTYVQPVSLGTVPVPAQEQTSEILDLVPSVSTNQDEQTTKMQAATSQIMANARPVAETPIHDDDEDHTIIAQVETKPGEPVQIVPGMENLRSQFEHASKLGSHKGVVAFLQRIAAVISTKGHTIDELLRFMSRGDLPIADDGSIIAYKVLTTTYNGSNAEHKGRWYDPHTKKVPQRIGSRVQQQKVDPSRRTQCSTGLHVARRGYLGNFPGNIIAMIKIAPEDVVAVPTREPNKMRVARYHILFEIPANEHSRLRSNQPIEGMEAKKLLARAIAGDHTPVIEEVVISGTYGEGVTITAVDQLKEWIEEVKEIAPAEPVTIVEPKPRQPIEQAPAVSVKTVGKVASEAKAQVPAGPATPAEPTRAERVAKLVDIMRSSSKPDERIQAAKNLVEIKKKARKPWGDLGVNAANQVILEKLLGPSDTKPGQMSQEDQAKQEEIVSAIAPLVEAIPETEEPTDNDVPTPPLPYDQMPRSQKAAWLLEVIHSTATDAEKRNAYQDLITLKKKSKVGWMQLGVDNFEAIQVKFEK